MTIGCQTSCWVCCCAPIKWICQCFSTTESTPTIPEAVEAIQNVGSNVAGRQQTDSTHNVVNTINVASRQEGVPTHNRAPTRSWKLIRVGSVAAMNYVLDTPTAHPATNETIPT